MTGTNKSTGDCEIELTARIKLPFGMGPGWETSVRFDSKDETSIRAAVDDVFGSMRRVVDKSLLEDRHHG